MRRDMRVKIISDDAEDVQEKVNSFLRKLGDNFEVIAITHSSSQSLVTVMIQYK